MRFIGDVDESIAREVASSSARSGAKLSKSSSTACRCSAATGPAPSSRWSRPIRSFWNCRPEHERLMRRIGLEPEGRKFTPHVTLARLRNSSSHQVAENFLARGHFRAPAV
jgi:2'-5' RNA ligase